MACGFTGLFKRCFTGGKRPYRWDDRDFVEPYSSEEEEVVFREEDTRKTSGDKHGDFRLESNINQSCTISQLVDYGLDQAATMDLNEKGNLGETCDNALDGRSSVFQQLNDNDINDLEEDKSSSQLDPNKENLPRVDARFSISSDSDFS
jgi:hypothetical protein